MRSVDPTTNSGTTPIPAAASTALPPPTPAADQEATHSPPDGDGFDGASTRTGHYVAPGNGDSDVDLETLLAQVQQAEADDAKDRINANAKQREALFAQKRGLQSEFSRTSPAEGLGLAGLTADGPVSNALWRPDYQSGRGMPADVFDAAYTFDNAATLLAMDDQVHTSGGGVRLITGAERDALVPPAGDNFDVFITEGGFRVDTLDHKIFIYEKDEEGAWKGHTRISGDPHVYTSQNGEDVIAKEGGWDWHYGEDSTFVLPDGSKIATNSVETSPGSGIFFNRGIDILSGNQRGYSGLSFEGEKRTAGIADDRKEFDEANADTKGTSGGVFAMVGNDWAKMDLNGQAAMVDHESWQGYLDTRDVTTSGAAVELTEQQAIAVAELAPESREEIEKNLQWAKNVLQPYAIVGDEAVEGYEAELTHQIDGVDERINALSLDLATVLQELQAQATAQKALEQVEDAYGSNGESGEKSVKDKPKKATAEA